MRWLLVLCGVLAWMPGVAFAAADLYRSRAVVTGEGEAERARGFALCLEDVLAKVSGDPRLAHDPAVAAVTARAADLVAGFDYHDRMSGIPVHDEQGTRERPFDLTVTFDRAKIDAALRSLGRRPWPEPRPVLAVLLAVRDAIAAYVLAADGARGEGQREALQAAAERRGVVAVLPGSALLAAQHLDAAGLKALPPPRLAAAAKASGGEAALAGTLVWSETAPGWTAHWRLSWHGKPHRWQIAGVSFDDAFRTGIDGAVAILSAQPR